MDYTEELKARLDAEHAENLEKFTKEYFELCFKQIELETQLIATHKRLKVLEALIGFYGELEKKDKPE